LKVIERADTPRSAQFILRPTWYRLTLMEMQVVSQLMPRAAYSLAEVESLTTLSRSSLYRLIAAGKIQTVLHGRRRLVSARELEKFLTVSQDSATRLQVPTNAAGNQKSFEGSP
jgi:excisionase family DNA binding protein